MSLFAMFLFALVPWMSDFVVFSKSLLALCFASGSGFLVLRSCLYI